MSPTEMENIVNDAKQFVAEAMKGNDPSHDIFHVGRVHRNALNLARLEMEKDGTLTIDFLVLQLAVLFHDIADFKYETAECSTSLESIIRSRIEIFFKRQPALSAEVMEKVVFIVSNMSFRKELEASEHVSSRITPEFRIARDADRLDAIGAIGIARCFGYSCKKGTPFYDPDAVIMKNMTAEYYNSQVKSTAYGHFYEKHLLLKDRMMTVSGRTIAEERHKFMVQFLGEFECEMGIE